MISNSFPSYCCTPESLYSIIVVDKTEKRLPDNQPSYNKGHFLPTPNPSLHFTWTLVRQHCRLYHRFADVPSFCRPDASKQKDHCVTTQEVLPVYTNLNEHPNGQQPRILKSDGGMILDTRPPCAQHPRNPSYRRMSQTGTNSLNEA